jgi:hypothetical protein
MRRSNAAIAFHPAQRDCQGFENIKCDPACKLNEPQPKSLYVVPAGVTADSIHLRLLVNLARNAQHSLGSPAGTAGWQCGRRPCRKAFHPGNCASGRMAGLRTDLHRGGRVGGNLPSGHDRSCPTLHDRSAVWQPGSPRRTGCQAGRKASIIVPGQSGTSFQHTGKNLPWVTRRIHACQLPAPQRWSGRTCPI